MIKVTVEEEGKEPRVIEARGMLAALVLGDTEEVTEEEGIKAVPSAQLFITEKVSEFDLFTMLAVNLHTVFRLHDDPKRTAKMIKYATRSALSNYQEELKEESEEE